MILGHVKGECHLFAPQEREVLHYPLVEEKSFIYLFIFLNEYSIKRVMNGFIVVFIELQRKSVIYRNI